MQVLHFSETDGYRISGFGYHDQEFWRMNKGLKIRKPAGFAGFR